MEAWEDAKGTGWVVGLCGILSFRNCRSSSLGLLLFAEFVVARVVRVVTFQETASTVWSDTTATAVCLLLLFVVVVFLGP